jgi:hypothetical protein
MRWLFVFHVYLIDTPSINFIPSFKKLMFFEFNLPIFSVKNVLSSVINWDTFTTESLLRFDYFFVILIITWSIY